MCGNFKLFRFLLQMIYYSVVKYIYYVGIYITTWRVPILILVLDIIYGYQCILDCVTV